MDMNISKKVLVIGIVALFFGMCAISAGANVSNQEEPVDGPGWRYILVGRIRNYEIVEYNGVEYLNCRAVRVNSIWWNVFEKLPNLPLIMNLRFGQEFNIPYEGAQIFGPTLLGHYFLVARGTL